MRISDWSSDVCSSDLREVGITRVFHLDQGAGRGNRERKQDDERRDRPRNFHLDALMEVRRLRMLGTAMVDDRVEHNAENQHADHYAHHERVHVQAKHCMKSKEGRVEKKGGRTSKSWG